MDIRQFMKRKPFLIAEV